MNSLKMYNIDVSKEKLLDNFQTFISLIDDAIKKYNKNSDNNFLNDNNQLLRDFSKQYDNNELGVVVNSLKYLLNTFKNYNTIDRNKVKRQILDKTYEMVMEVHEQYDKEEEEFNLIYERIEQNNRENQEYYDAIQKVDDAYTKRWTTPIQKVTCLLYKKVV